ncbi:MAG: endonuclease [Verrucomicrobiaceae bacterium]|nr:endonuclease [Verrucomicrobiaceae bacterium]
MSTAIRLMTYNVHSCLGTDGLLDPLRVAAVIAEYKPDIVALQELDVGRARSLRAHQVRLIAQHLKMEFHFLAAMQMQEEQYGDAILCRWPTTLRKASHLPTVRAWLAFETRGALWVSIDTPGGPLQVINTHLGLSGKERLAQIKALLGPEWLGHDACRAPAVLCGDFNAFMRSTVVRSVIAAGYRHATASLSGHRVRATFPSKRPLLALDHVFVSPDAGVTQATVPRTALTRVASDHLPLIVDLVLPAAHI